MKQLLKKFEYFYEMQSPEARIVIIVLTTIAAIGLITMCVNFYYYGI